MLEMHNVSFSYRAGVRVLQSISLKAERGKVAAVVGPNGSGKSTLLRLASGLLSPNDGRVSLAGRDTHTLNRREAARLAALAAADPFEDTPLPVAQLLYDAAYARESGFWGASDELRGRVEQAAARFELVHLLARGLRELSSGERTRVALARAVVQAGDLLLLDEPAGRLDYRHRERLVRTVRELAASGKAVLLVEHNLNVVSRLADTVLALKEGAAAASGVAADVLRPNVLEDIYEVRFQALDGEKGTVFSSIGLSEKARLDTLDSGGTKRP